MNKAIKECIDKLHEPFDNALKVVLTNPYEDQDDELNGKELRVFPEWLYARRLDSVFAGNWTSKISEVDIWGQPFLSCTIEVVLPDGNEFRRKGVPHNVYPFAHACELIGVGGTYGSILYCSRQLNKTFGFDWDITLTHFEEATVCELAVRTQREKLRTRSGRGGTDESAFINACEMFGINPVDDIPF